MGNAAAEGAEKSGEIIHYLTQSTFLGEVNMQTMYMTWVTMAIVFVLFLLVCKNPKAVYLWHRSSLPCLCLSW